MNDLISRADAIDAILAVTGNSSVRELYEHVQEHGLSEMWSGGVNAAIDTIIAVPSAQPELTDDRAIEHLQSTGWMQNHDKEMYEMGLREQLADDGGSYDSLIPSGDTILRQAAIDAIKTSRYLVDALEKIIRLPSAQPKTGQWLDNETTFSETGRQTATCSVCGLRSPRPLGDFCRWCGAHMTEGDDCYEKYLKNRAERRTDA